MFSISLPCDIIFEAKAVTMSSPVLDGALLNDKKTKTHICEYPLNGPGAAIVFKEDLKCLDESEWLNDNIISML